MALNVFGRKRSANTIGVNSGRTVEQNPVAYVSECSRVTMRRRPLPIHFRLKQVPANHRVHQQLQVVAGRGVAVQVDAARRLQDAEHVQVIAGPDCLVGKVRFGHGCSQTTRAFCSGVIAYPISVGL